jgi:L-rhamnose mutarotase
MIRKAFTLSLHPGQAQEYERRHRPIWPELEAVLKAHGAHSYSIFLDDKTNQLFGYVIIEDEARWAAVPATPECQRWWQSMKPLMPTNPDGSPTGSSLREVFHLA